MIWYLDGMVGVRSKMHFLNGALQKIELQLTSQVVLVSVLEISRHDLKSIHGFVHLNNRGIF